MCVVKFNILAGSLNQGEQTRVCEEAPKGAGQLQTTEQPELAHTCISPVS